MLRFKLAFGAFFLVIFAFGCSQATGPSSGGGPSGPLSGKVVGLGFTLKAATAIEVTTGYLTVYFWGQNASPSVSPNNPAYPYIELRLAKNSGPQTYAVTTFGTGYVNKPGIRVTGWTSSMGGTYYDSGDLTISKLDLVDKVISGEFRNLATTEGTSSLNGTFTATIQ